MKNAKPMPTASAEISDEQVQKVLEKFDLESNVRKVNNKYVMLFFI